MNAARALSSPQRTLSIEQVKRTVIRPVYTPLPCCIILLLYAPVIETTFSSDSQSSCCLNRSLSDQIKGRLWGRDFVKERLCENLLHFLERTQVGNIGNSLFPPHCLQINSHVWQLWSHVVERVVTVPPPHVQFQLRKMLLPFQGSSESLVLPLCCAGRPLIGPRILSLREGRGRFRGLTAVSCACVTLWIEDIVLMADLHRHWRKFSCTEHQVGEYS